MIDFKDNVAVITGAGSGIGKAIAEKCLQEGMMVALADNNKAKLTQCESVFKKNYNHRILSIATDVRHEDEVAHLAQKVLAEFGKINFLFNNAGIAGALGPLWEQSTAVIEKVLQVNLFGTIYGTKLFVPIMLKQNDQCFIINTCAGAGLLTGAGLSGYKISKHAVTTLTEVLYADLKKINSNIQVSLLIPHWVNTEMPSSIEEAAPQVINNHMMHLQKFGMSTKDVSEKVFSGIKEKQFYIFTHPEEHLPMIKQRMERILLMGQPG